jgi:hypothetical protein
VTPKEPAKGSELPTAPAPAPVKEKDKDTGKEPQPASRTSAPGSVGRTPGLVLPPVPDLPIGIPPEPVRESTSPVKN